MNRDRRPTLRGFLVAIGVTFLLAGPAWSQESSSSPSKGRTTPVKIATIDILDVGQGDAILIRSPEGKSALIDAGPTRDVVDRLRKLGLMSLDLAVVSHHHIDHYGGMNAALKAYPVPFFLESGSPQTSPQYFSLLERLKRDRTKVLKAGQTPRRIDLGSVRLIVLPVPDFDTKEENNNSVGIRVQFGTFSMLLTGDAEEPERRYWLKNVPELCADVTVLKLAHHGSRNGTSLPWLLITQPKLAVVSLGAGNDYGHPHAETLSVLQRTNIPLRRTDRDGSIRIETDGRRWRVNKTPNEVVAADTPVSEKTESPATLINVNTATEEQLKTLPGIGATFAKRIIEGRPYTSVDDLSRLDGLGGKRLETIRSRVTVGD